MGFLPDVMPQVTVFCPCNDNASVHIALCPCFDIEKLGLSIKTVSDIPMSRFLIDWQSVPIFSFFWYEGISDLFEQFYKKVLGFLWCDSAYCY